MADFNKNQVVKLASDGTEQYRLSGFNHPQGVSVYQTDGSVWVTDTYNNQVVKLDSNGNELIRKDGFNGPVGISVDQLNGSVWITDYNNNQMVKLASDGSELYRVGGFYRPRSVSVNPADSTVWVADEYNDQVVKLTPNPSEIARVSGFDNPYDVNVNPEDGTVWIADYNKSQIVRLAPDGTELLRIGGFNYPTSVSVDPALRNLSQPPAATANADPTGGDAPLAITFSGTATDDGTIIRYQWDFEGDGSYDYNSPTTGNTTHTYPSPGIYSPVFRVTDDDGMMDYDASATIYVGPITVFPSVSPATGNAPLDVSFNGQVNGLAPGRRITIYEWDFNGDGTYDWSHSSSLETTHRYYTGATYTATLRVTDDLGNMAFASASVGVNKVTPTAHNNATPYSGVVPFTIRLDGYGSDVDGSIVRFEWDYDGDGVYDWFSDTTANTSFTYTSAGTYEATLQVTDNDGLTAAASRTITVSDQQDPPTAYIATDAEKGNAPLIVNFTGTGSDPDDGTITLYEWDFDADGTYDFSSATTSNTQHMYNEPGQYNATLRVTDIDGLTATETVLINVKETGTPIARANVDPTSGDSPLAVDFDAAGSSDPDGTIVNYEWTFGEEVVWVADIGRSIVRRLEGLGEDKKLTGFNHPYRIAVDQRDGTVWISDLDNDQVVKLAADGSSELARIGGFDGPEGLAVDPSDGTVWVADNFNDQVVKLAADGSSELARVDGFNGPTSVAVNSTDGTVWAADYFHNQVVKLSPDGTELARISGFNRPYWVSVNPTDGSAWVADRYNNRIVKLEADTPNGYNTSMTQIILDATANNHNGWAFGDMASSAGQLNEALSFDGVDDYVAVDNWVYNASGQISAITVEAWVKTDSSDEVIIASWDRNEYWRLSVGNGVGAPQQRVYWATTGQDYGVDDLVGNIVVADGQWHFISVTYEAGTGAKRIYVDGNLDVETTAHGGLNLGTGNTRHGFIGVGSEADSFNGTLSPLYYSGLMDELRIWSTARTQQQIQDSMNSELAESETELLGYWRMNSVGGPYHKSIAGFYEPHCVSVNPNDGTAWVCDHHNNQVVKISEDLSREIVRVSGFNGPYEAYVNPLDGTVWVANRDSFWLDKLSPDGRRLGRVRLGDSIYIGTTSIAVYNASGKFSSETDGTTNYLYNKTGEYIAALKVTDNAGLSDIDTVSIKAGIFPESLPIAYPISGPPPLTVHFSANGKSPTGTIERFYWDFNGDGTTDWLTTISENQQHTYENPGTYVATQKVVDNRGLSDTKSITITVAAPDAAPTAQAIADSVEGNSPLTVQFTGLGMDTDGFVTKYEWDFDGNGTFDFTSTTTGKASHTYSTDGIYNAVLRVTDDNGNTGTDGVRIEVKPAGSPTATASITSTGEGAGSMTVDFTASATDPDGTIVLYEWDFDGDGTYEWNSDTSGNAGFTYTTPGSHTAVLRVIDNNGLTDTYAADIHVSMVLTASLSKDIFDPGTGATVEINSVLTGGATVTIKLKDRAGNVIRALVSNQSRPAGHYADAWDGRDDSGNLVDAGAYLYIIEYAAAGKTYTYDLTGDVDSNRYAPPVTYPPYFSPFDHETNFFRYTLDRKFEVTIYISYFGAYDDVRVKTLLLRKPQKAGSYVLVWDGTDDEGNLVESTDYVIAVFAWKLPDNAIIVNTEPIVSDLLVSPAYFSPAFNPYAEITDATFTYTLSKTADVTATIYNSANFIVKTITVNDVPPGSGNTITWNGKNENGEYVATGTYRFKLTATDADGNQSREVNALFIVFY
ncbi:PKD domain-containing protein [Thermodesulfobacteriota bacterium]